jgi:hypothetical protein
LQPVLQARMMALALALAQSAVALFSVKPGALV